MKNKYIYITLFIFLFLFTGKVEAAKELTCEYDKGNGTKIIYEQYNDGGWSVKYKYDSSNSDSLNEVKKNIYVVENDSNGEPIYKISVSNIKKKGEYEKASNLSSCKKIALYKVNGESVTQVYFIDEFLSSIGETDVSRLTSIALSTENGNVITEKINTGFCSTIDWKSMLADSKKDSNYTTCLYGHEAARSCDGIIKFSYNLDGDYEIIKLDKNLKEEWNCKNNTCDYSYIKEIMNLFIGQCPSTLYEKVIAEDDSGNITRGITAAKNNLNGLGITEYSIKASDEIGNEPWVIEGLGDINECKDLFSEELIKKINSALTWIRILVPIMIIGLGVVDFAQAVFAADEDKMKKAQSRFVKRIIIGIAIFIIPSILNIILELANKAWGTIGPDTCGIK